MDFSFIIPAYNEAANIAVTIDSIRRNVPDNCQFEIIVVDHGSTDDTVELAQNCGAKPVPHPEGTIAKLRNIGVGHSTGNVLVFLDADIRLTQEWGVRISEVARLLTAGERILTGSRCGIPDNPGWIEKFWFKPLIRGNNSYINSGHLIISRHLFDEIGGFNEKLETGEDYDFSMRARAASIKPVDDARLRVIHEGYPKNLYEFSKREYWHGQGDATSIAVLVNSKVAVTASLFVMLHLALLFFVSLENELAVYTILSAIAGLVIASAVFKYRSEPISTILVNSVLYYVYFFARGLSILSLPRFRKARKRSR